MNAIWHWIICWTDEGKEGILKAWITFINSLYKLKENASYFKVEERCLCRNKGSSEVKNV